MPDTIAHPPWRRLSRPAISSARPAVRARARRARARRGDAGAG
jgi:hypothetical protein